MKTIVYVDGFNLYYGAVKGTPYKWLDVGRLCELMLPGHTIERIKYFTARVSDRRPGDGTQRRQQTYLRALATVPHLEIHYGKFLSYPSRMPLVNPRPHGPTFAEVIRTEEKGSDVNLATHLLMDGAREQYEQAALITNDSDQLEPIRVVREEFGKPVGILNPHSNTSYALLNAATFYKMIRRGALATSQLPNPVIASNGKEIRKPPEW